MLKRSERNPILAADDNLPWCSIKVYNCAIYKDDTKYRMLFRGVGNEWVSRLGIAESTDGVTFSRSPNPSLSPIYPWEQKGCEDPRIVKIDGNYWVSYTAFDGETARAALTASKDLLNWGKRKLLFPDWQQNTRGNRTPDWSKAAAIFPGQINNQYYMLFGDSHIWSASSLNLIDWYPNPEPLISSRPGSFDEAYVEMGPPPLLTEQGWLVIYHGIDRLDSQRTYRLGAMLLDLNDPRKIIWRCNKPILEPSESYEVVGFVDIIEGGFETLKRMVLEDLHKLSKAQKLPKAVFCCGALLEGDIVRLYYGAGDTVICTATVDLGTIFSS